MVECPLEGLPATFAELRLSARASNSSSPVPAKPSPKPRLGRLRSQRKPPRPTKPKMTFLPSSSRRLLFHFRLLSTAVLPPSPSPPISLTSAKKKLRFEHDPDKALAIFSSISDPAEKLSACYALDLTVKRLVRARRFSDIESIIEAHKKRLANNPQIEPEPFISTLIRSYGRAGMLDRAINTFDEMDTPRSAVSFNALLSACACSRGPHQTQALFSEVPRKYGIVPDELSYRILVKSVCDSSGPESAVSVLREMEEKKVEISKETYTTVLSAFYKAGEVEEAEKIWGRMQGGVILDVAAYNAKMWWVAHHGKPEEVKRLMDEMAAAGLKPNIVSYNYLLICYGKNGMIKDAKEIFFKGLKGNGCVPNVTTFKTMVHYLCERGDLNAAATVCKKSIKRKKIPDFGTVKSLVVGLMKESKVEAAKELIDLVKKSFPDGDLNAWKQVEIELGLNAEDSD
ncbi:hypothetical protein ACLOJK_014410 [Asimina triloba]